MIQRLLPFALIVFIVFIVFGITHRVAAQDDARKKQRDNLRREIERLLAEAERRVEIDRVPPGFAGTNLRWGGSLVKRVDAELAVKLGLPEDEGILVAAVDGGSLADKAGIKANDVIVRLNNKAAPRDLFAWADLVSQQTEGQAFEIGIIRDGKEQTLKAAPLPNAVQSIRVKRAGPRPIPFLGTDPVFSGIRNFQMQSKGNGITVFRKQVGDEFTGSYERDDLKITIKGRTENRGLKITEITVQQNKETDKYTDPKKAPGQYRDVLRLLIVNDEATQIRLGLRKQYDLLFRDLRRLPPIPGIDGK